MAFLAPIIAGALGLGAIGQMVVGAGLAFAMGAAARALAPKPKLGSGTSGMRVGKGMDANAVRSIPLGRCATAGDLVYRGTFGPSKNEYLHLVFALGDCECDALEQVYADGVAVSWNSGDETVAEFPGLMWIKFYRGTWDQNADADLVANSAGAFTASDRGRGICYVRVKIKYDSTKFQSIPEFLFVIRGARLYDWRRDSTAGGSGAHRWGQPATYEWSDNPIVQLYNWRRGIWINGQRVAGMNTQPAALPVAYWTAAANACDELVALKAGGTEKRYRCGGVVATSTRHREVIQDILSTCAGNEIDTGGLIKPFAGVTQPIVLAITDADLMSGAEVKISKRRSRNELINAVFGTYSDPGSLWQRRALPPRISPADEAEDGGIRLDEHYALEMITSQSQGQRVTEIIRRRHRAQGRVEITLRARFAVIEAGDWISWTSERYGFTAAVFEVTSAQRSADQSMSLTLRAISASVYAFTTSDELDQAAPGPVQPGGSTFTTMSGLAVALAVVDSGGGTSRPGIAINWTVPSDPTVVQVAIEFRRVGDTTALARIAHDPLAAQAVWIDGVQGDTVYEVRIRPVTFPERATVWTGWVAASAATAPIEIDASGLAPGTVTIDKLDPQTRFEISLATAIESIEEGVGGRLAEIEEEIWRAAEAAHSGNARLFAEAGERRAEIRAEQITRITEQGALASRIDQVLAATAENAASIYAEATARADDFSALAQSIQVVETSVDEQTAQLIDVATSIDGIKAHRTIAVNVNNQISGSVTLAGTAEQSTLDFLVNVLRVVSPGGGTPVPMFTSAVVDGVAQVVINGELIAKSIRAAIAQFGSLEAVVANFGTITTARILSPNGKLDINAVAGTIDVYA